MDHWYDRYYPKSAKSPLKYAAVAILLAIASLIILPYAFAAGALFETGVALMVSLKTRKNVPATILLSCLAFLIAITSIGLKIDSTKPAGSSAGTLPVAAERGHR